MYKTYLALASLAVSFTNAQSAPENELVNLIGVKENSNVIFHQAHKSTHVGFPAIISFDIDNIGEELFGKNAKGEQQYGADLKFKNKNKDYKIRFTLGKEEGLKTCMTHEGSNYYGYVRSGPKDCDYSLKNLDMMTLADAQPKPRFGSKVEKVDPKAPHKDPPKGVVMQFRSSEHCYMAPLKASQKGESVQTSFKMTIKGHCVEEKDKKPMKLVKENLDRCTVEYEYSGPSACGIDLATQLQNRIIGVAKLIYGSSGLLMICSGALILLFDYQYVALAFGIILWFISYQVITLILCFWTFQQNTTNAEIGLAHLIAMVLSVIITYFGAKGFTGVFFGIMMTVLLLAVIFVTMQQDLGAFVKSQGSGIIAIIACGVIWTFSSLYIHFQKFFNSGIGALLFVRGLAHLLGGFPDEAYNLTKTFVPQLVDPKVEAKLPECGKHLCWSFWVYLNLFAVICVFRIIFREKFAKLDFFKTFDDAVRNMEKVQELSSSQMESLLEDDEKPEKKKEEKPQKKKEEKKKPKKKGEEDDFAKAMAALQADASKDDKKDE